MNKVIILILTATIGLSASAQTAPTPPACTPEMQSELNTLILKRENLLGYLKGIAAIVSAANNNGLSDYRLDNVYTSLSEANYDARVAVNVQISQNPCPETSSPTSSKK